MLDDSSDTNDDTHYPLCPYDHDLTFNSMQTMHPHFPTHLVDVVIDELVGIARARLPISILAVTRRLTVVDAQPGTPTQQRLVGYTEDRLQ